MKKINEQNILTSKLFIKKSEFSAYICNVNSKEEVEFFLKKYFDRKSTHNCFAYKFFNKQFFGGMSDDGEPKNTAGKAIFNVIEKSKTENVCILVTRKFGGIKLGAGPLTRAYTKSASEVIKIFKLQNK